MNKFCPNCGTKICEEGAFCVNCGFNLAGLDSQGPTTNNNHNMNNYAQMQQTVTASVPTSGMAITGFVLGIVSLCCCCYTNWLAIPGLIFSILGLDKTRKMNYKGRGLAIAGIVMNSISIFCAILWLIIYSVNLFEMAYYV